MRDFLGIYTVYYTHYLLATYDLMHPIMEIGFVRLRNTYFGGGTAAAGFIC